MEVAARTDAVARGGKCGRGERARQGSLRGRSGRCQGSGGNVARVRVAVLSAAVDLSGDRESRNGRFPECQTGRRELAHPYCLGRSSARRKDGERVVVFGFMDRVERAVWRRGPSQLGLVKPSGCDGRLSVTRAGHLGEREWGSSEGQTQLGQTVRELEMSADRSYGLLVTIRQDSPGMQSHTCTDLALARPGRALSCERSKAMAMT